jgi:bacillithiol system protein YtxJ
MFFSKKKQELQNLWQNIAEIETFQALLEKSNEKPLVIFKHSNRCSISSMALNRFSNFAEDIALKSHLALVDVVADRPVSLHIADELSIQHQSPQVLVIKNGKVVLHNSHNGIDGAEVLNSL